MKKHILIPFAKYTALMQRATCSTDAPKTSTNVNEHIDPVIDPGPTEMELEALCQEIILRAIPKRARSKATILLNILDTAVQWNAKGEVFLGGKFVRGSHIADLIRFSSLPRIKPPKGAADYIALLATLNVPRTLIAHASSLKPPEHDTAPREAWLSLTP